MIECIDEKVIFIVVNGIKNKWMVQLEIDGQSNNCLIEWIKELIIKEVSFLIKRDLIVSICHKQNKLRLKFKD